ncbi:hypothetical protein BGP77_15225 [Saccharospirillum sp. MSK14-1]|uniref:ABC-F family ATP-binding cassette domain-containing protein n=1 Tax=Saccharospirillum sp. MSK14-1 TaxID=1897632 RepID=UPI000D33DBB8|nr:ABC-F family ATP-binding cassette domain-containing protein [Saccharospirillum sp. MSK14-1]PTY37825.1 hypothetical protein BGP77_15225 [Saccharospirillum sp. MSK14-1]
MPTPSTLGHCDHLTVNFDDTPLFADLSASLQPGLTGLVGRNGQGKSVLMSMLAGERRPTSGSVSWNVPTLWLQQLDRLNGPRLVDALDVGALFDTFARVEAGQGSPEDLDRLADRWHEPADWRALLDRAGLHQALDASIDELSGGERTRLALCRALLRPDHYLLLDEPTNHLDRAGRAWLLDALAQHPGGALIASHDRTLLRQVDRILELTNLGLAEYGGNYDHYRAQTDAQRAAAEARLERLGNEQKQLQRAQQAELQKAAQRRRSGEQQRKSGSQSTLLLDAQKNRAETSLGSLKRRQGERRDQLSDQLKEAKTEVEQIKAQRVSLQSASSDGRLRLHLDHLQLPFGCDETITLSVHGGERWHLDGANGSGKSTLLKIIAGQLEPKNGQCDRHGTVRYLDQHFSLLDPQQSATENLLRLHPHRRESDLRTLLAGMRLRRDDALRPVGQLSGGERLKVALLAVTAGEQSADLLLLDEPDNHLDLESRLLLEQALADYQGTLMVVSHDPDFIAALQLDHTLPLS